MNHRYWRTFIEAAAVTTCLMFVNGIPPMTENFISATLMNNKFFQNYKDGVKEVVAQESTYPLNSLSLSSLGSVESLPEKLWNVKFNQLTASTVSQKYFIDSAFSLGSF
ncbi:MAG: hypothetical protein F6J94_29475 [Moorea sp. SIO1F2]|uniref:hypothetical protein n=1 Tax=unclassified Moorena TaxID=2683338 RepID=UPI0013B6F076|nr:MULTISPECIES: hypothetical protein [unclassified Moorena]NEN99301.1 hypothetical protein [Moorena sp. SIO3I7]NEO06460.1 hypothetical protein [Moorena sp. SIO3I8]NEO22714.1 hypothetical protein [Moorena sp. SIO4A5]NEP23266.1 hypothetical protein [Moorena sp. SIO3I6]NEQ59507.1 hypothetical protein [Moorena sp. SIO4A1]